MADDLGLPTRESEAAEWTEAAVMLLVKDGLDIVLTGTGPFRMSTATAPPTFNVAEPQRVVGDLDGFHWTAAPTYDIEKGVTVSGFEVRTPEGMEIGGTVHSEHFPARGTFTLTLDLDFWPYPMRSHA